MSGFRVSATGKAGGKSLKGQVGFGQRGAIVEHRRSGWIEGCEEIAEAQEQHGGRGEGACLDDGSLQYYLGQFVYGFLNSRRTDEFFVGLLDRAEANGTKVWFIDTLPQWNFCLGGEPEPWRIDCRVKYERFYARCAGPPDGVSPACQRLPIQ